MQHFDHHPLADSNQEHKRKSLSVEPCLHDNVVIRDSYIGSYTEIGRNTWINESTFGDYSYTAGDVLITYADIGRYCSIASHVRINPGNHPMWRVTQHHMTYRRSQYGFGQDDTDFFQWRRDHRVYVGHDVWIGHGAIIMPGVSIGTGVVIGSSAVVTKDVEPYTIVAGVPAKPIRKRFSDEVITKLLRIGWWDWDRKKLENCFEDFYDLDTFLSKYGRS